MEAPTLDLERLQPFCTSCRIYLFIFFPEHRLSVCSYQVYYLLLRIIADSHPFAQALCCKERHYPGEGREGFLSGEFPTADINMGSAE